MQVNLQDDHLVLDFQGECENIILKCENKKILIEWK